MNLQVDPARVDLPKTGFYVRAQLDGTWSAWDIAHLTRDSLFEWLRSRGGANEWAESVVFALLGHET
jgi:hypothetical protein